MKKHNHVTTMQRGILFLMTSLLLVASLACSFATRLTTPPTPTPSPTETVLPSPVPSATPAPPPAVLYSEDFSDPYSGWLKGTPQDDPDSSFQYLDGEYVISRAKGSDIVNWAFARQNFYDSVVSVDIRHISGDSNITGPVIYWRVSQDYKSFYWLFVYGNGQFSIQKVSNGVGSVIHDWEASPAIKRGQKVNHIDITSIGDLNSIYINGTLVATFNDTSSLHGDVALGAASTKQSEIEVAFDNLIVYSPENWVPTKGQ